MIVMSKFHFVIYLERFTNLLYNIFSIYRGVQKVLMPMFWFDQVAELSPELASTAKVSILSYIICLFPV